MNVYALWSLTFLVIVSGGVSNANAECVSKNVSLPSVNLKFQGASVYPAMMSSTWHEAFIDGALDCVSRSGVRYYYSIGSNWPVSRTYSFEGASYGVYETANPAVGMILAGAAPGGNFVAVGVNSTSVFSVMGVGENGAARSAAIYRYRYIALNKLPSGVVGLSGKNVTDISVSHDDRTFKSVLSSAAGSISVNNLSCSLSVPAAVKLTKATVSSLSSTGASRVAGNFQLRVRCGTSYLPYKVLYSMSDINSPGNTSSILKISSQSGAASGVGLQILDAGVPISFGPAFAPGTFRGKFGDMGVQGGDLARQLSVNYVRSGGAVKPGVVSAGISVTLSYD